MKKAFVYLSVLLFIVTIAACGSSGGSTNSSDQTTGTVISGSLTGTSASLSSPTLKSLSLKALTNDDPDLCPGGPGEGPYGDNAVDTNLSPTEYTVALKRFALLGDDESGTEDYEVFAAESVDEAYIADFVNDTEFFAETGTYPDAGTYDGILIELFYVDATFPMIIPAISETEAYYSTRNYFYDIGNAQTRDVAIENDDVLYWLSRADYELTAITGTRPPSVLDLWADEDFWDRDPLTISTENSSTYGLSFSYDGDPIVIPEDPDGLFEIRLAFNVQSTFTFKEYLENGQSEDADGKFTAGFDCGYRIFFPSVTVTATEPE